MPRPPVYVHRVIDDLAHLLGIETLEDGGYHRRLFTVVQCAKRQQTSRIHHVGVSADTRQRFLDPFELADRGIELLADMRIGAGRARAGLARGDAHCR